MLPLGHGQGGKFFCIALFSVYVVSLSQLIRQIWPLAVCPNRWPCSVVVNGGSVDDVGLCFLSGSLFKRILGVVVHACNPRTRAVKAAGSLC